MAKDFPEVDSDSRLVPSRTPKQSADAPRLERDGLPEIAFDLSFLDQREAFDVEEPEVGDLQMRNHR